MRLIRPAALLQVLLLYTHIVLTQQLSLHENHRTVTIKHTVAAGQMLTYPVNVDLPEGSAVKLVTEVVGATEEVPLLLYLHQHHFSKLVQVPSQNSGNSSRASRTLCPLPSNNSLNLTVTTHSERPVSFVIDVMIHTFLLTTNQRVSDLSVSRTEPQVLLYKFDNLTREVLLRVETKDDSDCSIVAVHPATSCPFSVVQDLESSLRTGNTVDYQTMLLKSIMIINTAESPAYLQHGFNIFILGTSLREDCFRMVDRGMGTASRVSVVVESVQDVRVLSTVLTVSLYVVTSLIGVILLSVSKKYKIELVGRFDEIEGKLRRKEEEAGQPPPPNPTHHNPGYESDSERSAAEEEQFPISIIGSEKNGEVRRNTYKEKAAPPPAVLLDVTNLSNIVSRQEQINMITLEQRTKAKLMKRQQTRSSQYSWLILTVGIYYTLPVVQLVLLYQSMATLDGNRDLCYYNYECQYPWGIIQDFGNVFSNIGYVCLGIFFSLIVAFRRHRYRQFKKMDANNEQHRLYGIPEQFGIYTALGLALTLEGVLSAAYHICPTQRSFQFDTTFMFFIAILLFLKIYQFRHPNVIQTARTIFLLLGIALIFETLGYYAHSVFYTVAFIIVYMTIMTGFLCHLYWDGSNPGLKETFKYVRRGTMILYRNPRNISNISWPFIILLTFNIAFAVFIGITHEPDDVSNNLLGIFMMNMALYLFYYIGMKMWMFLVKKERNEHIRWITWLYLVISLAFALPSLYFFKSVQRTSSLSPAESRHLNAPCSIGIYDSHDLWHFLSASGLFYLFLFVLTLEDGNMDSERKNIKIF